MGKFTVLIICFICFVAGVIIRSKNIVALGNSCSIEKEEIIYSPNKRAQIKMQIYQCGLFKKEHISFRVIQNNTYNIIDINNGDISWSGKSFFNQSLRTPKIVWKNNFEVEVYIKSQVRYGNRVISLNSKQNEDNKRVTKSFIKQQDNNIEYPINVIINYERQE